MPNEQRIAKITLDEKTVVRRNADIEQERAVAIFDLLEENSFAPVAGYDGPFHLALGIEDHRLVLDIRGTDDISRERIVLSLAPFRGIVKDYFLICESYFAAIKRASTMQIEPTDMRRPAPPHAPSDLPPSPPPP